MESLSVGGLASGLDTNAIIDGLTNLEANKVKRIVVQQNNVQIKLDAFNQLNGLISEFSKQADHLDDVKGFNLFESTSSDEEAATLEGDEDAVPGSYSLEVQNLASKWKVTSKGFATTSAVLGLTGNIEISKTKEAIDADPTEKVIEVSLDANDSLKDIVNKINGLDGAGVTASIISLGANDNRLVLSSVEEGTKGFYLKDVGGTNILDASGLGIISDQQQIKSDFNFRLNTIGAATTDTVFSDLFSGIGSASVADAGDEIGISGTDANGNTVTGNFVLGAASTVQDLLDQIKTVFESQGSAVNVNLNSSGEILISDTSGGVQDMTFRLDFNDANASGSDLKLSAQNSQGIVVNNFSNVLNEGKKAFLKIDGLSVASESNKAKGTVNGVTFNLLKAEPGTVLELGLNRDKKAIKERVEAFIGGYNTIMEFIEEKSKIKFEGDSEDPNDKQTVASTGPFASDSSILRIKNELRRMITSSIDELGNNSAFTSLASIGITSNSDATISIDDDDLTKAIEQDFNGVRNLFISYGRSDNSAHSLGRFTKDTKTGVYSVDANGNMINGGATTRDGDILTSTEGDSQGLTIDAAAGTGQGTFTFTRGVASQISAYWKIANDSFDGYLTKTKQNFQDHIDRLQERAEAMEVKVESFRERLIKQFSNLEVSMSRLQSQSASFSSQIGSLG